MPTVQGWLYLACVTDVFSPMVIGWSMASHRKTDLVVRAACGDLRHGRGRRAGGGNEPGIVEIQP